MKDVHMQIDKLEFMQIVLTKVKFTQILKLQKKKDCLDDLKRQSEWKYVSPRKEWKLDF